MRAVALGYRDYILVYAAYNCRVSEAEGTL